MTAVRGRCWPRRRPKTLQTACPERVFARQCPRRVVVCRSMTRRCLTLELTGLRRQAARAWFAMMHHVPRTRLAPLAVAGPVVQRRVRPAREVQRAGRPRARGAGTAETGALRAADGKAQLRGRERSSLNAQCVVIRLRVLSLGAMPLLQARSSEFRAKPSPGRIEVEVCGSVPRVRGQVVWASRLRRAVMSPEKMLLMQA